MITLTCPSCDAVIELVGSKEVAEFLGWDYPVASAYQTQRILPKPDAVIAGLPLWLPTTILQFAEQKESLHPGETPDPPARQ